MTTQICTTRLSARDRFESFDSRKCGKPSTVVRDGVGYCNRHDPERAKAKAAAKCYERVHGRLCGKPAVEQEYGYGRCAEHCKSAVDQRRWLGIHGPALLEAARAVLADSHGGVYLSKRAQEALIAAIAAASGKGVRHEVLQ